MRTFFCDISRTFLQVASVVFLMVCSTLLFAPSAHAELSLTSGTNATTTPNVATAITGFQIVGASASTTPVQLRVSNGSLSMLTTDGLTFAGASTGGTINFTGTVEDINTALATLRYTRATLGTDTLEVSLVNDGEVFFTDNGHLYQYISGSYTWAQAKTAAEALTAYGSSGYLATIASSTENTFVYERISGDGWLGATDASVEDTWVWATGPETGTAFYSGRGGLGGAAIDGRYHGWANNEPNDHGVGEDCGYMYASQDGEWNDFPCSAMQGYVVEFGASGDLPEVVATNITIVTADVPAITTLSPTNGATEVSPSTNLVIGLSKNVTAQTGNILIKKSSDHSTAATIDVASGLVTGSGTNSITINPNEVLDDTTAYYILIPGTGFIDQDENLFEGISATSTWTFTTADTTGPVITSIATSTVTTSTLAVTWNTSESASSKVVYGPTIDLGIATTEQNTSTRVLSHSIDLEDLLPCTSYQFAVVSRDIFGNSATSSQGGFITPGCTGDGTPGTTTSTAITVAAGGSTSVEEDDQTLTVSAPSGFTPTSTSVVIQIMAIPNSDVLTELGRPALLPNEVGSIVFDVKAIINNTTVLDSFDQEITITYTYRDEDITRLDESTLWLYHHHDGEWQALNDCTLNRSTNTISCTTPSFSIFGLFGTVPAPRQTTTNSGGIPWWHVDPTLLPAVAPFIINNNASDAPETTDPHLTLTFNADPKTVSGYTASLRPDFASASIFPLSDTSFRLPDTPGTYRVYLKYYSITGKPSHTFSRLVHLVKTPTTSVRTPSPKKEAPTTPSLFTRVLKIGSVGEDVQRLQRLLNDRGFTIKTSGSGSKGNETTVYGPLTAAALLRLQEAYASSILTPLGLRRGTGIAGPSTIRFINQLVQTKTQ
jgi:hypothetical protein